MNTRHKIINLCEDDEDYTDIYSNKKGKNKDSDEEYNINEDNDLYSNVNEEDASFISYIVKKNLKNEFMKATNKKSTIKKLKIKQNNRSKKSNNIIRKSFKNSLGGKNYIFNQDNKENINTINSKKKTNIKKDKNKNTKTTSIKKVRKNEILKNQKEKEKQFLESKLDKTYFYQNLTSTQWKEITNFISSSLFNKNLSEDEIENFFIQYPDLSKGENNIQKLRQILNDCTQNNGGFFNLYNNNFEFNSYQKLNEYIIQKYYMVKPSIFEVHFFPNSSEEMHLINLISKTKISLDIAMFTINNIHIAEEIKKIFYKGIKLRIITDGECIKMPSSNIYSLAAIGINIKTDDSVRYHMHHKFCVIDNSVVVTGSFNWTDQAVNHNQENLLFLENKDLAIKYSNEFQKLWDDFVIVITKEKALSKIKEDEEKKMAAESRKRREKEKKLIEKENKKKEINEMEIDSYDNCYNKSFSKKKRNRYENKGFEQNNNDNNDKDTNDENNNNINDKQESKGSNCLIF